MALRAACTGEGCDPDEVLLTGLTERIRSSRKRKVFVVLHTSGGHSHDQVFHSVVGALELTSHVHDESLDLFHR